MASPRQIEAPPRAPPPRLFRRGSLRGCGFSRLLRLGGFLLLLRSLLLDGANPRLQSILLYARQHLLLHRELVLALQLLDGGLVLRVVLLELLDVAQQLVLLLADAFMVHAVQVALLAKLIPRRRRLGHHRLLRVHLGAKGVALLVELLIVIVHVGHDAHVLFVEPSGSLELVPLRLELLQRRGEPHPHEKVPHEVVHHLREGGPGRVPGRA